MKADKEEKGKDHTALGQRVRGQKHRRDRRRSPDGIKTGKKEAISPGIYREKMF